MKGLRNKLIALAALPVLAIIGSFMDSHNATAQTAPTTTPQGSVPVTIVSPIPLPVTGTITGTANVNVVNTSASPVFTVDLFKTASRIVELRCIAAPVNPEKCSSVTPGGNGLPDFTVPTGQSFILTSADVFPNGVVSAFSLVQGTGGFVREGWIVPAISTMVQLQFPTGIVIQSGDQLSVFSGGGSRVTLHGYLTPM